MIRVECGKAFSIRLMMEEAAGLPDTGRYEEAGQLTTDQTDGGLCMTLVCAERGERP